MGVSVEGTRQLLAVAREAGVRRFVHMGTEAVLFVGQPMIEIDESYPYPEKHRFLYSESKAVIEQLVQVAGVTLPDANLPSGVARALAVVVESIWKLLRLKSEPPLTRVAAAIISSECTLKIV